MSSSGFWVRFMDEPVRRATSLVGQGRTKPRTRHTSSDDSFTPIADEKINQINTVAMCHRTKALRASLWHAGNVGWQIAAE